MNKFITLILVILTFSCQAENTEKRTYYNDFNNNPYLSKTIRRTLEPYILPYNHPLKSKLDAIFLAARVTQNIHSFNQAGFITLYHKPRSFIRVARHPDVPGYLFKIYLDSDLVKKLHKPGWFWLACRCKGASQVRKIIAFKKMKHFDVAEKWLYPLPLEPSPPQTPEYFRQPVVLIVKDMQLVSEKENLLAWKTQITKEHLNELFLIIKYARGRSYRADNICLNTAGKFCFIDTEYPGYDPNFKEISFFLNDEMRAYWEHLTKRNGR